MKDDPEIWKDTYQNYLQGYKLVVAHLSEYPLTIIKQALEYIEKMNKETYIVEEVRTEQKQKTFLLHIFASIFAPIYIIVEPYGLTTVAPCFSGFRPGAKP